MNCTYREYLEEPWFAVEAMLHWDKVFRDRATAESKKQKII